MDPEIVEVFKLLGELFINYSLYHDNLNIFFFQNKDNLCLH